MANTFEEQAKERFRKSLAFLQKANALLQDDLVFRSALADSVSATKNMLQGYLLLRIAATPTSAVTQRWQEASIGARMPDLIRACGEAGLNLHGLDREIQRLNNERNYRAHDDPQRFVDAAQADKAYELAITVQRHIKAAVQGREVEVIGIAPPARSASSRLSGPMRAAVSNTLDKVAAATRSTGSAVATAVAGPAAREAPGRGASDAAPASSSSASNSKSPAHADASDDDVPATDDTYSELPAIARRSNRGASVALRIGLLAAALILGIVAGFGLSIPVANGAAPGFLGFAKGFYAAPTATRAVTPTATLAPTSTPQPTPVVLGTLTANQLVCVAPSLQLTLINTGATAVQYAVGATSPYATVAVGTAVAQPAHFASLPANTNVTLTLNGLAAKDGIVIVTSSGSVQLSAPAC